MPNNLTIQIAVQGGQQARQALSQIARAVQQTARESNEAGVAGASAWGSLLSTFRRGREALEPLREHFGELRKATREFGESLEHVANNIFPHFKEIAEISLAAAGPLFVELAKHSAEGVRETTNFARSLGLTVEQYEQLKLAAARAGVDQETLNTGLARFARSIGNASIAAKQGGDAAKAAEKPFRDLGISIGGSVGHMWTSEGGDMGRLLPTLQRVTDSLSRVADSTQKAAIAEQFFGRGWLGIMPAFTGLDKSLTAANETIERYGIGLTQAEQTQAQQFNAAWTTMATVVDRVKEMVGNAIGASLVPAIQAFTEVIGTNSGAIREWAAGMASQAEPILKDFIALIQGGGRDALQTGFMRGLYDLATGVRAAFTGLLKIFNELAAAINLVFGTQLTGGMLLAIALVVQFTGAFGLLINALRLARAAADLFWEPMVANPAIAIPLLAAMIAMMVDWNGAFHNIGITAEAFWGLMKSFAIWVARGLLSAWQGPLNWIEEKFKTIAYWVQYVWGLARKVVTAAGAGLAAGPAPGYAAGGSVSGPAGRDRVPIWATAGEFIMKTAAVARYGRGFMESLNAMHFATGGFVGDDTLSQGISPGLTGQADLASTALSEGQGKDSGPFKSSFYSRAQGVQDAMIRGLSNIIGAGAVKSLTEGILPPGISAKMLSLTQTAGRTGAGQYGINLNIDGKTFHLQADASNGQALINFARLRRLVSAGKLPSSATS